MFLKCIFIFKNQQMGPDFPVWMLPRACTKQGR